MKIHQAKFVLSTELGKKTMKWDIPVDLKRLNKKNKYRTIVGIGKWRNNSKIYVGLSQGNEIIFINKKIWLQIAKMLPNS